MIWHGDLRDLVERPEVYPVLAAHLGGAMATVSAPGGERHHYIEDAESFPLVRVAVQGSASAPVRLNFFTARVYADVEWELSEESETIVSELIALHSAGRVDGLRAALAEQARAEASWDGLVAEGNALCEGDERAVSLARLRAARGLRRDRRDWSVLALDLYRVRDDVASSADRAYVVDIVERQRRSSGFVFSDRQVEWFDDILERLIGIGGAAVVTRGHAS